MYVGRMDVTGEWGVGIVMPILRKGREKIVKITEVLAYCVQLYAKIIARRISVICEPLLSEDQNGFRRGRSCTDSLFIIQQLLEKHRVYNIETHLLFVDYYKAFYSVLRNNYGK
jgi:hypothetical protein